MNKLLLEEKHKENMLGIRTFLTVFFESIHQQLTDELMNKEFLNEYITEQKKALAEIEEFVRTLDYSLDWLFDAQAEISETIDVYMKLGEKAANFQLEVAKLLEQHFPEKYPDYFFAQGNLQAVVEELTTELEETTHTLKNTETSYKRLKTRHENIKQEFLEETNLLNSNLSESQLEIEKLQGEVNELETTVVRLKEQMEIASFETGELLEQLSDLQDSNEKLNNKVHEKESLIQTLEATIDQIDEELKITSHEKDELLGKLDELSNSVLEEKRLANQEVSQERLKNENAESEREALIQLHREQMDTQKAAYEELIAELNNQLAIKETAVTTDDLPFSIEDYRYLEQQLEETREQLLSFMSNESEQSEPIEGGDNNERLEELYSLYTKQKEYTFQIEEQFERLKEENQTLQQSLANIHEANISSHNNELIEENAILQDEINQLKNSLLEKEQESTSIALTVSQLGETIQKQEKKIAKLEIANQISEKYYIEAQKELNEIREAKSFENLSRMRKEKEHLAIKKQLDTFKTEKIQFETKINDLLQWKQYYEQQLYTIHNTPQGQLYQEMQKAQSHYQMKEKEIEQLKNEKMEFKNTIFYKTKEIDSLNKQINELNNEINSLKEKSVNNVIKKFFK